MPFLPLPSGVSRRPGKPAGIAVGADRSLCVDPGAGWAQVDSMSVDAWMKAARVSGAPAPGAPAPLWTARHRGSPAQPDVLLIDDVPLADGSVCLGSNLGHWITDNTNNNRTQAVLEFHSYGLAVIDIAGAANIELWIGEPGGKISIQAGRTNLTVLNLDERRSPLTALLAYDPARTQFSDRFSAALGPILSARYVPEKEIVFTFNPAYVNRPDREAGVTLTTPPTAEELVVRIPLRAQIELGPFLAQELFDNARVVRAFGRLNVRMLPAPGGVELAPAPGEMADLRDRRPLVSAMAPGRPLHHRLYGG